MPEELSFDVGNVKRMYNWFYHGFNNFENNKKCSPEDIMLNEKT